MNSVIQGLCPRSVWIVTSATIGLALTVGLLGCPQGGSSGPNNATLPEPPIPTLPLFAGWDEPQPRAVLVFSGDEHGYLEPCGCSERQSGGFGRRADLLRQIREERKWPVTAFDNGGILDIERVSDQQSRMKFSRMLDGFNRMGYQGMVLGHEELLLGSSVLFEEHTKFDSEDDFDVPFLASNVTIYGSRDLGTPINSRIVQVGEARIGVIGLVGQSIIDDLTSTGRLSDENDLKIDSPVETLRTVLSGVQAENPDLIVVMAHADVAESESLATEFPEIPVIVAARSAEDPRSKPRYVGETMIVEVGRKGKNVAVVGLYPDGSLKHELVELDMDRFASAPEMTELMQDYQNDLAEAFDELTSDATAIAHPTGATFVGAESCKECHRGAYGVWSQTRHAHAFESLSKGRENYAGTWVDRTHDPECLACHSTGWDPQRAWRYESGFVSPEKTPLLAGQQCENCHGPASLHVELETAFLNDPKQTQAGQLARTNAMAALRLNRKEAEAKVCSKCHDHDNSPKFNFEGYWPKVNHSGLRK